MPETFEAEALFLFPAGCTCENNGDYCDFCNVYYDGECPDCNHHVLKHRGRNGCQQLEYKVNGGIRDEYLVDTINCGCERLAMFYKPISTHWKAEAK